MSSSSVSTAAGSVDVNDDLLLLVGGGLALGLGYVLWQTVDLADGAADFAGDTAGGFADFTGDVSEGVADEAQETYDGAQDAARGTGDVVSDGMDWWLGGGADVVENSADWFLGGTADHLERAADDAGNVGRGIVDAPGDIAEWADGLQEGPLW